MQVKRQPMVPGDNVSMDEVVVFNETPSGKLVGDDFGEDVGFQRKKAKTSKFKVVRVKGQVTWKYKGSGDDDAVLLLKRLVTTNGKTRVLDELALAEYPHGASSDEFTSLTFDFKPDNDPFWQTDKEGKAMPGLNYKLDPQVSLRPRNCYHTRTHTHTHILSLSYTHTDYLSLYLSISLSISNYLSHTHTHTTSCRRLGFILLRRRQRLRAYIPGPAC